jgi:D-arabinose 1-dehydrogenase-like Zn-dependent alcohol dehydrogenase
MAEALDFAVRDKVKADIELQPLADINDIFKRLQHGDVPSRVVLDFSRAAAPRAFSKVVEDAVPALR